MKKTETMNKNKRKENSKACEFCGRSLIKHGQHNHDGIRICGHCHTYIKLIDSPWGWEED